VALLLSVADGMLDALPLERVAEFRKRLDHWLAEDCAGPTARIDETGDLVEPCRADLAASVRRLAAAVGTG
jgi:hypothetical protein